MEAAAAKLIGVGIAVAGGALGAAIGIGIVFSSLMIASSRNPSISQQLFKNAIFGFALTEAALLFALLMAFVMLFVF